MVVTQLGQMTMGLVDTYMVGKLGPEAIGGVAIGNAIYFSFAIFGIGLLLGLDYLISHAFGKKSLEECHYWLVQAIHFSWLIALPLMSLIFFTSYFLIDLGIQSSVAVQAGPYMRINCINMIPFFMFMAFRQYLQAMNIVRPVTLILLAANIFNAFFNWVFIYGHLHFSPMGVVGSGMATTVTRFLMLACVVLIALYYDRKMKSGLTSSSFKMDQPGLKRLWNLGLPAAFQLLFEVAVFSLATFIAGRLGAIPLAAHSIVLNVASLTFMVPLGISAAAAVRVGQALGEKNPLKARQIGWLCMAMSVTFMALSGVVLFTCSSALMKIFTTHMDVIDLGKKIFILAAVFQIADGLQTTGTGALRGLGETRTPMLANLWGHWLLGLPIGFYLCFYTSAGVLGLWIGLTIGLICVSTLVLRSWRQRTATLDAMH